MTRIASIDVQASSAPTLEAVLSVTNCAALLAKAFIPGSACALAVDDVPAPFGMAVIRVERDEAHYAHPSRHGAPAGALHPFTAALVDIVQLAVEHLLTAGDPKPPDTLPAAPDDAHEEPR
jgi:hypothetical protein